MTLFETILTLAISLGAVFWGVAICHQRGTWFLAGWNTMSRAKKASYRAEALCRLYGKCVVFCGVGAFLLLYGSFNGQNLLLCVGLGVIALMVAASILVPILNPKKYRK